MGEAASEVLQEERCPGCGAVLPAIAGPTHPYIGSTPSCWALYGEVLTRDFGEPWTRRQLVVDTYAAQHPGTPGRRSIQSVAVHLMALALWLEQGADPRAGPRLRARLVERGPYVWLEPPRPIGELTIADVHRASDASGHRAAVDAWARDVWGAWAPHHRTVRRWLEEALRRDPPDALRST